MKLDRMIGILAILLQQEKATAPALAEIFEVSRRTINRDIEALCMAGIPIATQPGQNGGISIMEGYKIDRTLLSKADMQAILAGLRSLDSVSGTNRYGQLMEKLSAGASKRLLAGDSHILIDLSSWYKASLTPKIEQLHGAILSQETISFTYYAPGGKTERTIEPYDLVFQWASWYVWGWCHYRQDFRLFKLNRMTDLRIGKYFEKRQAPLPDLSQERVFPNVWQVKARIHPDYQWRLVEEFGLDSFEAEEDGSLLFSFGFSDKRSIICWIASFGEGAELLEPSELRREIVAFAEGIRNKYQETYRKMEE